MGGRDWAAWHMAYDDPDSFLARRLAVVWARIREVLDAAPRGPIRVVSMCAGEGRDLFGVLADHRRARDVTGRLVELDARNATVARKATANSDSRIEVVQGDAALTDNYVGAVPADLVLACGVFGNVTNADISRTISFLPQFVAERGSVIWTRHRGEPDVVPAVNRWFVEHGFELIWLSEKGAGFGVGVHRRIGAPEPLRRGERLFTFVR